MKKSVGAKFRDDKIILVSRADHNEFYEYLYRKHLSDNGFSFQTLDGRNLVTTPDGLQLVVPDFFSLVFDEVYLMRIYGTPNLTSKVVVDIGAAIADTSLYFAKLGAAHVYAFEMDSERCKLTRENIQRNNLQERVTLFEEPATATKINAIKFDFIKIDCEGCEYELVPNLQFDGASGIVMEYHKTPEPLVETLRNKGFDVTVDKEILSASRP